MYRKKLTYSFFTVPVAIITYNVYDFHRRKGNEKLKEMQIRKDRIFQEPTLLNLNGLKTMPWANLGLKEFNEQFAYKPVYLYGEFDHSLDVKVARNKEGERGYQIITPFYCYANEKGESCAILVDRGWVEIQQSKRAYHRATQVGPCMITGVIYKGGSDNKYSKDNYPFLNEWNNLNLYEIATYMRLNNREEASQGVLKVVQYDDHLKTLIPVAFTPRDLFRWTITPEKHQSFANLWLGLTYANLFFNTFFWLYL